MEYKELCCFDHSAYTGLPDSEPCPVSLPVPEIISQLDAFYQSGREAEALRFLSDWLGKARACGDWRAELSILSELLGQARRCADEALGLRTADEALSLIRLHRMGETVSGATVMLNAATTLKCFGRAAESIPIFTHVCRVYAARLDPMDYRFGGLYNNMALSYADTGDREMAEKYFLLAMHIIESCPHPENDLAVTLCNLAELYAAEDMEDPRIASCLDKAWDYLNAPTLPRDAYHAFTASKCAPCFGYFGYFLYARELSERAEKIYAGG